jgi:MerR family transcriptional regulator/heat shock protein HspR
MTEPASDDARPLYAISVAAELAGLPIPTLRLYEQHGLVTPARSKGGTRRYSERDVRRVRRISDLVEGGVTLAAVGMVLGLQDDNAGLTTSNEELRRDNTALRAHSAALREQIRKNPPRQVPDGEGASDGEQRRSRSSRPRS